jgi:predicted HTH transcriptional regulator
MSYPNSPGYKVEGPSKEAAQAENSRASTLRDKVAQLIQNDCYTADECAAELNESILAIRPRLSELVKMGRITDSGQRRKNESGHNATVWRYVTVEQQQSLL